MNACRETTTNIGLSRWRFVLPSVLLWMAFVSSAAQSATLSTVYDLPDPSFIAFNTGGNLGNSGPEYFGLNNIGSNDLLFTVSVKKVLPKAEPIAYRIALVSPFPPGTFDPNALSWFDSTNSLTYLLAAGEGYILSIGCEDCANVQNIVAASEVPLPAAAWLFGSALVGFIMMSNRRSV